jgi:hypothetical protein
MVMNIQLIGGIRLGGTEAEHFVGWVQSDLFIQLFQHSTQNHWVCGPWPSFEI